MVSISARFNVSSTCTNGFSLDPVIHLNSLTSHYSVVHKQSELDVFITTPIQSNGRICNIYDLSYSGPRAIFIMKANPAHKNTAYSSFLGIVFDIIFDLVAQPKMSKVRMDHSLYSLLISELQICSMHRHLIIMVKINPSLFSALASIKLNPVIKGSTTILTWIDIESIFKINLQGS